NEMAARLPSAVPVSLGMLVVFDCARRLTSGFYGMIAMTVLSCSYLLFYGYEARPYGLCFLFSAVLLWIWLNTAARNRAAWVFGGVLFVSGMFHYYSGLCLAPYVAYDLLARRPLSRKSIAGAAGALLAVAVLIPQLRGYLPHGPWEDSAINLLRGTF